MKKWIYGKCSNSHNFLLQFIVIASQLLLVLGNGIVSVITWDLVRVIPWYSYVQEGCSLESRNTDREPLGNIPALVDKMLISLGTILTYQFLLSPSESNQRPCDVLLKPNVIGPARNTKMIDRCHTSNKSDEHTLECEDTDTLRGDTLGKWHSVWLASCYLVNVKKDHTCWCILNSLSGVIKWPRQELKRDFKELQNVPRLL